MHILPTISFYFFAFALIFSALMVVLAKSPVRSVLFLISCFIASACLFIMIGAPYLGFLILIIYVGAVAVLFLFVVMMLDVDFSHNRTSQVKSLPLGLLIMVIFIGQFILAFLNWNDINLSTVALEQPISQFSNSNISNISQIGSILYTDYFVFFQISGLILLVAMIGAIILTFRKRKNVKRQNPSLQAQRKSSLSLKDPKSGHGL